MIKNESIKEFRDHPSGARKNALSIGMAKPPLGKEEIEHKGKTKKNAES